jgi:hypothetical protein
MYNNVKLGLTEVQAANILKNMGYKIEIYKYPNAENHYVFKDSNGEEHTVQTLFDKVFYNFLLNNMKAE